MDDDDSGEAPSPTSQTIRVRAFDLPLSDFLSAESKAALARHGQNQQALAQKFGSRPIDLEDPADVLQYRRLLDESYFPALIRKHEARYRVQIREQVIAGVPTQIIVPAEGISSQKRDRVLISLHGGAFMFGSRWGARAEAIPIAALSGTKVISIDYRLAPEHRYPAATDDVAAVYQALLTEHAPQNIGIYGSSAGAFLAAQATACFLTRQLPIPAAIAMLCGGALPSGGGDSERLWAAIAGARSSTSASSPKKLAYMSDPDLEDPLAFPGLAPSLLSRFPASLLVSSTRDFLLSSVAVTHARLRKAGVNADLHVWEGLNHVFFYDPDLPESREVYELVARFFDAHLREATRHPS